MSATFPLSVSWTRNIPWEIHFCVIFSEHWRKQIISKWWNFICNCILIISSKDILTPALDRVTFGSKRKDISCVLGNHQCVSEWVSQGQRALLENLSGRDASASKNPGSLLRNRFQIQINYKSQWEGDTVLHLEERHSLEEKRKSVRPNPTLWATLKLSTNSKLLQMEGRIPFELKSNTHSNFCRK